MDEDTHIQTGKKWSEGYVYVIDYGDKETFKIGTTKHSPEKRLSEITRGSVLMPMHLVMYMKIDSNAHALEQLIHMKFDGFHVNGEWFKLDFYELVELAQILKLFGQNKLRLTDRWFLDIVSEGWANHMNHVAFAHFPAWTREEYEYNVFAHVNEIIEKSTTDGK